MGDTRNACGGTLHGTPQHVGSYAAGHIMQGTLHGLTVLQAVGTALPCRDGCRTLVQVWVRLCRKIQKRAASVRG